MDTEPASEQDAINHDRNFKELISHFFTEFIDLFFPDISAYLDPDFAMVPLDKEISRTLEMGMSTKSICS